MIPQGREPGDLRAELAVELADLDDRLEALQGEGPSSLWLVVPVVAVAALGAAGSVALRALGPYPFAAWVAVTLIACTAIVGRTRNEKRAERGALEAQRALITARINEADPGPAKREGAEG